MCGLHPMTGALGGPTKGSKTQSTPQGCERGRCVWDLLCWDFHLQQQVRFWCYLGYERAFSLVHYVRSRVLCNVEKELSVYFQTLGEVMIAEYPCTPAKLRNSRMGESTCTQGGVLGVLELKPSLGWKGIRDVGLVHGSANTAAPSWAFQAPQQSLRLHLDNSQTGWGILMGAKEYFHASINTSGLYPLWCIHS